MSETLVTAQPVADQLPLLPETRPIDPIIQCGVLYLGTAPTSAGLRGLDSIQQPFSHRYPVDGTNTVRGIDAVLSIYDNGLQLAFTRQPYTVIFFPINSLIYCSSLRFSIIENDQTKPSSSVDWRFMPLDRIINNENKHPPLFAVVVQRTQILPGEECHCFITKSTDAALALVRTISEVYANLRPGTKCLKSPIFYQLDRFGRKLSEISGVIYISPANDDDSQLNRTSGNRLKDETMIRHYLFDPSYDGFFYRTDASLIEQWQLWDDDNDLNYSRPRPPASPFGLHEGLYHDDTTTEIQRYLRHMDDEDQSCTCTSSSSSNQSSSCSTMSSISTKHSRKQNRYSSNKPKTIDNTDQFNLSFSNLQTSSFEPVPREKQSKIKKRPIIIEKVLPKPILSIPILNPKLPLQSTDPVQELHIDCNQPEDSTSISYQINEHGEKITKEGNRIVYMDVIQMNPNQPSTDLQPYKSSTPRIHSHRHRTSKKIPMIDMRNIERLFNEENSKQQQRRSSLNLDNQPHIPTPDPIESTDKKPQQRKSSLISSTHSAKSENHRNHSTITGAPLINYVERPLVPSLPPSQIISPIQHNSPIPPVLTDKKINEYISDIYGTTRSVKSTSSSTTHQGNKSLKNTAVVNPTYMSTLRYMQSSMNRNAFEQYRDAY